MKEEDVYFAGLDDEEDIASSRPFYKRRSLAVPQPYLTVTTENRADESLTIVYAVGDLDLATVLPFRDAAFTAIGHKPKRLILDMSGLDRLDITGLNTLLTVGRVARLVKIAVTVRPSPRLRALLQVTGLVRQMPILEDGALGD
jgi:anti-sigma B factor antagonist